MASIFLGLASLLVAVVVVLAFFDLQNLSRTILQLINSPMTSQKVNSITNGQNLPVSQKKPFTNR